MVWPNRFRQTPTFGRDTIRKFRSNTSELKQMAARDFEDILQVNLCLSSSFPPSHKLASAQYLSLTVFCPSLITVPSCACCLFALTGMAWPSFASIRISRWTSWMRLPPRWVKNFGFFNKMFALLSIQRSFLAREKRASDESRSPAPNPMQRKQQSLGSFERNSIYKRTSTTH